MTNGSKGTRIHYGVIGRHDDLAAALRACGQMVVLLFNQKALSSWLTSFGEVEGLDLLSLDLTATEVR